MRASFITAADQGARVNVVTALATRVSDSRFRRTVVLSLDGTLTPTGRHLHWKIDRFAPDAELVETGDSVRVALPCDRLHLVCEEGDSRRRSPHPPG
jgi:hypothetical protein